MLIIVTTRWYQFSQGIAYTQLFGLVGETDYPYVSGDSSQSEDCLYNLDNMTPVVGVTGYNTLTSNDQAALLQFLAHEGQKE